MTELQDKTICKHDKIQHNNEKIVNTQRLDRSTAMRVVMAFKSHSNVVVWRRR